MTAWFAGHPLLLGGVGALSLALIGVTILMTPRLVARLPQDYFSAPRTPLASRGPRRLLFLVLRNVVGLACMALGLVMMVTPGPGLVGLLLGLSLCEFPGKHALLVRLATRPDVFDALNRLRRRRHSPPFHHP